MLTICWWRHHRGVTARLNADISRKLRVLKNLLTKISNSWTHHCFWEISYLCHLFLQCLIPAFDYRISEVDCHPNINYKCYVMPLCSSVMYKPVNHEPCYLFIGPIHKLHKTNFLTPSPYPRDITSQNPTPIKLCSKL